MALPPELRSACKAEARGSFSATPNGYSCPSDSSGSAVIMVTLGLRSLRSSTAISPAPSNAFRHLYFAFRLMWNCSSKPLARMTVAFFRSPQGYQSTTPIWNAFPGKADAFIGQVSGIGLRKLPTTRVSLFFFEAIDETPCNYIGERNFSILNVLILLSINTTIPILSTPINTYIIYILLYSILI